MQAILPGVGRRWRRTSGIGSAAAMAAMLAACAAGPAPAPAPRTDAAVLLLGEVHDNRSGHALRLQALQRVLAQGRRPALLMEQFDREQQAGIDRLVQAAPGMPPGDAEFDATVDALVKLGSQTPTGWEWDLYRPVLKLALQYRLPLVAANVSRAETRRVIQQGLAASGYEPEVPADIARAQAAAIEGSHCGSVDAAMAARLATAQVARDQFMARQIEPFAARGVVLLAGNGHVRRDIGVPRWLPTVLRDRSHAVGYLETGDEPDERSTAYDEVISVAPQARPDPCAELRARPIPAPAPVPGPVPTTPR